MGKTDDLRRALEELQENHRQCNDDVSEKVKEVRFTMSFTEYRFTFLLNHFIFQVLNEKSSLASSEQKQLDLRKRQRDVILIFSFNYLNCPTSCVDRLHKK